MKKDALSMHREAMRELHSQFTKKTQFHNQKPYLELKDVYWLSHEFFSSLLGKENHYTEEELIKELKNFKHDFLTLPPDTVENWSQFFHTLSGQQYAGREPGQDVLHGLVQQFGTLLDETIGREAAPADDFTRSVQAAKIFVQNGEFEKAENAYKRLMTDYEHFSSDKKRLHYSQLEQLYESIAALRSAQPASRQR